MFTLTGTGYFCQQLQPDTVVLRHDLWRWGDPCGEEPDRIEFRLYKFGQLIDSRRWRWLHAEASRYGAGAGAIEVGFHA